MKETPPALEKRSQPGRLRAIILAVIVHAIFFGLIVFGVTWQNKPEAPVEAELWKEMPPTPRTGSKPPEPDPTPPKPEPDPPKVEPKPEPVKPPPEPPKPVKAEPPKPDPAVAEKVEREKREKEKREKVEREKQEKEKREAEKKRQDDAKKKADDAKKKQEDAKKKQEDDRVRKEADQAREAASAVRQKEFDRYVNNIRAKIQGKANPPDNTTGRPEVVVRIRILPGGEVLEAQITRPSGNRAYDEAILRGIRSASPLPVPPADSELFPQFRDLNLNFTHER
ncbi:hypothetical protein DSM104443_01358 [Usitatibacter rugosus]|uniref:Cell division and transport-associated protein TolA n=1 Tax=Usitatibacter rugosus TaxID=2732067 RepID=A0A6M4GV11_9PROT|nr:hypothetical protein DSM104443_01358 [Usitatibacter rugosus]